MMGQPTVLGEVFARRDLELFREGRPAGAAALLIGRPVPGRQPEKGDPWWCPLLIQGLGEDELIPVAGEDSLQALTLALDHARQRIPQRAQELGLNVRFLGTKEDVIFCHLDRIEEQAQVSARLLGRLREALEIAEAPGSTARDEKIKQLRELVDLMDPPEEKRSEDSFTR